MSKFSSFLEILAVLSSELEEKLSVIQFDSDPETIHRCRVCVRALRGIIKFYGEGAEELDLQLKKIGKSLGPMRDLEVQIEFLKEKKSEFDIEDIYGEMLYQWDLRKAEMLLDFPKFSRKRFIARCRKLFRKREFSNTYSYEKLYSHVSKVMKDIDENLKHEKGLHLLRIKLKKVRYILEAMSCIDKNYCAYINDLKKFQDLLGKVHDLFVCQEYMEQKNEEKFREYVKEAKEEKIRNFIEQYPELLRTLNGILCYAAGKVAKGKGEFSDELRSITLPLLEKRKIIKTFSQAYTSDFKHVQRVTVKCKKLAKILGKDFKIARDKLFVLESAAMLHDIGHKLGEKKHNIYGKELVMMSKYLPFNIIQREKISWLIEHHRGSMDAATRNGRVIKLFAGILRCADGMEIESLEFAKDFQIEIGKDELIFNLGNVSDTLKERFVKKAEYLGEVLNKKVVLK